jgi:hypothetical protein
LKRGGHAESWRAVFSLDLNPEKRATLMRLAALSVSPWLPSIALAEVASAPRLALENDKQH